MPDCFSIYSDMVKVPIANSFPEGYGEGRNVIQPDNLLGLLLLWRKRFEALSSLAFNCSREMIYADLAADVLEKEILPATDERMRRIGIAVFEEEATKKGIISHSALELLEQH